MSVRKVITNSGRDRHGRWVREYEVPAKRKRAVFLRNEHDFSSYESASETVPIPTRGRKPTYKTL